MDQRTLWNEHTSMVDEGFKKAQETGKEVESLFDTYLDLEEEKKVLDSHWLNWNKNRFEIVVVGEFSTGKSTFINALLQKEVLPNKVTPTTATINYIRHTEQGDGEEKAVIHFFNGEEKETPFDELDEYVTEMSKKHRVVDEVAYVDLFVSSPYLKDGVVIVDTPGLQALHPEHERITKEQIKKSNASILLFNMEQPGKKSEFTFLKDLSDSIERIFFVGNRMDGVPDDEIEEVIESLEKALRDNEYQQIPEEQAVLYPISALQALKARDDQVKTKQWNDWSSEKLIETSRFQGFEERLEDYLFNGEKAKDLIKSPFQAILQFYNRMKEKIEQIEVLIAGEVSVEQLQAERERLMDEIELRKLQLQDKERTMKNILQDAVYEHEKSFNERRLNSQQHIVDRANDIQFIEDLEDEVSSLMIDINKEIDQLVNQSLHDLASQVEMAMRREMDDFELTLHPDEGNVIQKIAEQEISISAPVSTGKHSSVYEEVDARFADEEKRLYEEKDHVKQRLKQEQALKNAREKQKMLAEKQQSESRFHELLLNSSDATKKQYGVLKKRKFWFDKKGMVDVDNERYMELVKEKKELLKKQDEERQWMYQELSKINENLVQSESEYHDMQDWYEAKRDLQKQKEEEKIRRIQDMTKAEARQLNRERKKVVREIENIFENVRREYRTLLRGLDALKLAQQSIEEYIQQKDVELNQKLKELELKEQLLTENEMKQERYREQAQYITEKLDRENENITNKYLQLI